MTDEELAKESLISYRKEPKWAGKIFMQDENTCYKDGFLAGLKAGRPQWHKVADGDLPKKDERFSANVSIPVMTQDNNFAVYYYDDKKWYSHEVEIGNVIAWCEIPKYTEE